MDFNNVIYFDNASTTKVDEDVINIVENGLRLYENPNSLYSEKSKLVLKDCRCRVAKVLGCEEEEIYFTSGATEGNNWVLSNFTGNYDQIITSKSEHDSVFKFVEHIGNNDKYKTDIYYVGSTHTGIIDKNEFFNVCNIGEHGNYLHRLCSIMYVNNIVGTIQPIKELAKIAHLNGCYFHTDATQAIGHEPINVKYLGVDYLTCSGHKFGAPKGIGILYAKKGVPLNPYIYGGGPQNNKRAGTENLPYIQAITFCLEKIEKYRVDFEKHIKELNDYLRNSLEEINELSSYYSYPEIRINSTQDCTNSILNFSVKGIESETLLLLLEDYGIAVSGGSACDSAELIPPRPLVEMGVGKDYINGAIRVSFSYRNTIEEIRRFKIALTKIFSSLKNLK